MRQILRATAAVVTALTMLTACGDDEPASTGSGSDPVTIEITFEGGTVEPSGERVEVAVGQQIELVVKADEGGEIHVHSSPEQELEYEAGESTVTIKGIDQPGTVDVESHTLEKVIVQLEVR
jgi:hypothetical protein